MARTALVTGGSSGLGLELARRLRSAGDRVVVVGRREAVDPDDYCQADLRSPDGVQRIAEFAAARGPLDLLLHNAAVGWIGPIPDQPVESIEEIVDVDLRAPLVLTRLLIRLLRPGATIAFISSVAASAPSADYAVYSAAKAAIEGFARSLRIELEGRHRVVVVCPGAIDTPMHERLGTARLGVRPALFPRTEVVAERILAMIDRGTGGATDWSGGAIRLAGRHFTTVVESMTRPRLAWCSHNVNPIKTSPLVGEVDCEAVGWGVHVAADAPPKSADEWNARLQTRPGPTDVPVESEEKTSDSATPPPTRLLRSQTPPQGGRLLESQLTCGNRREAPDSAADLHQGSGPKGSGSPSSDLCVITGAAAGIGRALAEAFARTGRHVVGVDVDRHKAEAAETSLKAAGLRATYLVADVARPDDREAIRKALESLGRIEVLVHNAGINRFGRFEQMDLDALHRILDVNLVAPLQLTRMLLAGARWSERADVVFVASLSCFLGYPGAAVYAAGKDGLASYASSLAVSARSRGVRVLTVFPGPTRTRHARENSPDNSREHRRMPPEELASRIVRAVSARRRNLIPGIGNRAAALFGEWLPTTASRMLGRALGIRRDGIGVS